MYCLHHTALLLEDDQHPSLRENTNQYSGFRIIIKPLQMIYQMDSDLGRISTDKKTQFERSPLLFPLPLPILSSLPRVITHDFPINFYFFIRTNIKRTKELKIKSNVRTGPASNSFMTTISFTSISSQKSHAFLYSKVISYNVVAQESICVKFTSPK